MRKFVHDLFTGPDGDADEQALISILAAFCFLGLVVFTVVWLRQAFEADKFALGLAGLGAHRLGSAFANSKEGTVSGSQAPTP